MVIKYDDALKKNNDCSRLFLPSCHLTSKFPKLTYNTVQYLKDIDLIDGMTEYCCGQPLYAAGLYREFIEYEEKLNQKLIEHQVQTIITPCPNCFYFCQRLQKMGYMKNINIQCLSEELVNRGIKIDRQKYPQIQTISIHDSCPDRHHGYFSKSLRDLLNDFQIIELPHNKENTICCGCGGLVLAYKSEFAQAGIDNKVKDYMEVKTDAVITTCFNCFDSLHNHLPIHHYLELLIEEVDYEKYQNAKLKI